MDVDARNDLVLRYRGLARLVALSVKRRMPPWIELDDLEAWALMELLHAAEDYDPSRCTSFPCYAWRRVRGRVWDHYRRSHYAQELGSLMVPSGQVQVVEYPTVDEDLDRQRERALLAKALATLPARDRELARLYYADGLFLKAVGKRLGVNESRTCQLNKRMLVRMRRALEQAGYSRTATG